MQKFPSLQEQQYVKARLRIHSVARLAGRLREALVQPIAKNDNIWLSIVNKGFCTPPMNALNELEIGFNAEILAVEIADNKNRYASVKITGKTLSELCAEVLDVLKAEFSVSPNITAGEFDNERKMEIDPEAAQEFLLQFVNFSELLNSFHKGIPFNDGIKSQIFLWPHHFDNAFKWFSGRKIDEIDEYMEIGVSNGDEMYELPYVYFTIHPELRKMNTLDIPESAYLHDSGWQGLLLTYEAITEKTSAEEQAALINNFFDAGFKGIKRGFSKR
ncbi:MAG: hypothetical protein HOP31_08235 [Ignavibacteria bacterium]|nr:hypothetical protein [Ignavibacteria bacterium]